MIMNGADILVVKEMLGHKTLAMTVRYAHLSNKYKQSIVEKLYNEMDTFWTLDNVVKETKIKYNTQNPLILQ